MGKWSRNKIAAMLETDDTGKYRFDFYFIKLWPGIRIGLLNSRYKNNKKRVQATLARSNMLSMDGTVLSKDAVLDIGKQLGWQHGDNIPDDGPIHLELSFEILDSHLDADGVKVIDEAKLIEVSVVGAGK